MPSPAPQPLKLLHYLSSFRVLICKECRYAIQPAAISRHLKELHHIYRGDRQVYLDYALRLDLADPEHVVPPEPHQPPVTFLPIEKGVACEALGCGHLCVTVKRMKQHWATVHKHLPESANDVRWHSVNLQTFFRGNQLRYFVVDVNASSPPILPLLELGNLDLDTNSICGEPYYRLMVDAHSSELGAVDNLELLHHFMTSTYVSFGDTPETQKAWLSPIIDMAFAHPFLMHGILACAATHLSSLSPPSADSQRYDVTAAQYHGLALPAFRNAIASIDEHNCHAIMAFSHLLVIMTFALQSRDQNLLLGRQKGEDMLPDWMIVLRGGCTIFRTTMPLISQGPMRPYLNESTYNIEKQGNLEVPYSLDHLLSFPFPDSETKWSHNISSQTLQVRKKIFLTELETLRDAFLKAYSMGENFKVRTALLLWPARVSQEFLALLKTRDPSALVLLSHWSVLLRPLEVNWYLEGFPFRLLRYVWSELPAEYRCWLQWPMQMLELSKSEFQDVGSVVSAEMGTGARVGVVV